MVKDQGQGMSADQVVRVLEPFTQLDDSTTRAHGGMGLGLPLSLRLCEAMGGGLRIADLTLVDDAGDSVDCDALGLTLAADVRTRLCSYCCNTWSWVYGGRVAVLGGDWEGDNTFINTIVEPQVRDDNLFVQEIYAGVEYVYGYNGWDLYSRVTFEMQNWRSDVLGEVSQTTDSISFIGPGISFGVNY